jgi:hypothetical protein
MTPYRLTQQASLFYVKEFESFDVMGDESRARLHRLDSRHFHHLRPFREFQPDEGRKLVR